MRRIQSYLAAAMVLAIGFFTLPRTLVHDCGHGDAHAEWHQPAQDQSTHHAEGLELNSADCPYCDLSAPALTQSIFAPRFARQPQPTASVALGDQLQAQDVVGIAPSRAPPVC